MVRKRRQFDAEYKAEIVQLVVSGRKSVAEVCKEHGLYDSSVYTWLKQAKVDAGEGPAGALTTDEKRELAALRKENRELRRERDFLGWCPYSCVNQFSPTA